MMVLNWEDESGNRSCGTMERTEIVQSTISKSLTLLVIASREMTKNDQYFEKQTVQKTNNCIVITAEE